MTGTLFSVSTLPKPLGRLAGWIPITHALTGMRMALLQGADFNALVRQMAILALFCAILLPLSLWVFSRTLRSARRAGTLSFY